jgi:hypothetical protein
LFSKSGEGLAADPPGENEKGDAAGDFANSMEIQAS